MNLLPVTLPAIAPVAPIFTAADFIELERSVGNIVSVYHHAGKTWVVSEHTNRVRHTKKGEAAYIEGMWRFRAWQAVTPDWADQVENALVALNGLFYWPGPKKMSDRSPGLPRQA